METRHIVAYIVILELAGQLAFDYFARPELVGRLQYVAVYAAVIGIALVAIMYLQGWYSAYVREKLPERRGSRFITDLPIFEDTAHGARADSLGFSSYAKALGDFARTSNGPFTIGIQGSWGQGKTSLLRAVEAELAHNTEPVTRWLRYLARFLAIFYAPSGGPIIVPVRFNAWQYEREARPLLPLVLSISAALDTAKSRHIFRYGQLDLLRRALRGIAAGVVASTELKSDAIGGGIGGTFSPAKFLTGATDAIRPSGRMHALLAYRTAYYQAFQVLQDVCRPMKDNVKIVLFIDDLDRCSPQKALEVLEEIKLVLWQPQFIFFLAIDSLQLESYINGSYKRMLGEPDISTKDWGREYFEKLMQVTFRIPQHNQWYDVFIDQLYRQTGWKSPAKKSIKPLLAAPLAYNPRRTIGVMNTIILIESLLPESFHKNTDLIAVEVLLKIRYGKRLYTLLCGDSPEENEIMRSHVMGWEDRLKNPKQTAPRFPKTPHGERTRELWEYLAGDETLYDVFYSAPGLEWLQVPDDDRRGIARLIEDQKIENNFIQGDVSPIARGNEAYMRGDYTAATEYFESAIKADEHNIDAYIGLQKIEHARRSRGATATRSLKTQKVPANDARTPTASEVARWLDNLWEIAQQGMRDKKYLRAEKALLTILKLDDRNVAAWNRLGIVYAKQREYTYAIESFEIADSLEPSASTQHNLGLIYYETQQYKKSAQAFKKAIDKEDTVAARYIAYAKALEKLGHEKDMFAALQRAVELKPTQQTVSLLVEAHERFGQEELARSVNEKFGKSIPRKRAITVQTTSQRTRKKPKSTKKPAKANDISRGAASR